ncbi:MAG: error-prone DNA polymerase, partial [Limnobacter sp.]|nr:error-prone DNA polymerase [Limnobacter sp.]
EGLSPGEYLKQLAWEGACTRFKVQDRNQLPEKIHQQIQYELKLISDLQYEPYFLTVYDIVRFARSHNILCQGRGSAANSTVCYCLGITEVDPDRTSVLFERFISKERNEPPDIDVDFEHHRREEVIQYIYRKYGRHRAALAATVVVYRPRSAIRDAGKALGLDPQLIDQIAKSQDGMYARLIASDYAAQAGVDLNTSQVQQCLHFADQLLGFPRHLSQHTGGFVIARDTLAELVPVENASMTDRSVIQWDKDDLDAMGLLKVDVLALGMLSAIQLTLQALQAKPDAPRVVQDIPPEDPVTYDMISKADTIGVFQIESRAQMGMLPRLQPRCFYDLVIQVAIVRPGPIQGGMVHPFLKRRQGHEAVQFPSPALREALERTEGVPIFQEQVMQIAILAAGFTPGEADQLRRGMAAWKKKGGLHHFYDRVVGGMVERGYQRDFAESIFKQIEGFGEYGFPESHAASFALLVYVSCWLKCHHPDAFLCGLLNAQPMGFYQPPQLIRDARQHGVKVLPVDVQHSDLHSTLQGQPDVNGLQPVRLGLNRVRGLSVQGAQCIAQEAKMTPFESVEDLAKRASLNKKDLLALADANALESLVGHRRQAAWATGGLHYEKDLLFDTRTVEAPVELCAPDKLEEMVADYRATGSSLSSHPVEFLRPYLEQKRILPISTLKTFPDRRLARACGVVTHRQKPATANGTLFLTLEDETAQVNVIVWPQMAKEHRHLLRNAQIMAVFGVWQREGEVHNLIAKRVEDYTSILGEIQIKSRDFH